MKKLSLLLLFLVLCTSISAFAQAENVVKTDVRQGVDVVKVYEQVVKEGYGTPAIYKKLANTYYFKNEYQKAKKWFEKLFDVEKLSDATLKRRYRQTLKALNLDLKDNQYLAVNTSN